MVTVSSGLNRREKSGRLFPGCGRVPSVNHLSISDGPREGRYEPGLWSFTITERVWNVCLHAGHDCYACGVARLAFGARRPHSASISISGKLSSYDPFLAAETSSLYDAPE